MKFVIFMTAENHRKFVISTEECLLQSVLPVPVWTLSLWDPCVWTSRPRAASKWALPTETCSVGYLTHSLPSKAFQHFPLVASTSTHREGSQASWHRWYTTHIPPLSSWQGALERNKHRWTWIWWNPPFTHTHPTPFYIMTLMRLKRFNKHFLLEK